MNSLFRLNSKHEGRVSSSKLFVDSGKGFQFVFHCALILIVKVNLEQFRTIDIDTSSLSNNFAWKNNVIKHGIVDRSGSLGQKASSSSSSILGDNSTSTNNNDVLVREFFFYFTNKSTQK